jgi:hypothetical protein
MAALDLSALNHYPYVAWTATPGTAGQVRLITLPSSGQYQLIVHNRDKASKDLRLSMDQTLTDGGAAPASQFITIDNQWTFTTGDNRTTGLHSITKLALFSVSSTAVNIEILINEVR